MRLMTKAADKLLITIAPKARAGACHCAYNVYTCYCRSGKLYKVYEGYCVGCPPACGCAPPVCRIVANC